jgi:dihydroorotate dehydrogenase
MGTYSQIIFPLLCRFDSETIHERTVRTLEIAQKRSLGRSFINYLAGDLPSREVELFGLRFPNELGVAAGFDKDGRVSEGLSMLGFGHVEVGTVTPEPQAGNAKPRVFRLRDDYALINSMGFPSSGSEIVATRLQTPSIANRDFILGLSLGKQKNTPLEDAKGDYLEVMKTVYPHADYLAVNISSPNTMGLRDLQSKEFLSKFLSSLAKEGAELAEALNVAKRPLLVKIAPDLSWPELDSILTAVEDSKIDGIIANNTTTLREGLKDANQNQPGGVSGRPIEHRTNEIIRYIWRNTSGRLPIVGVGGVFSATDVTAKLDAGAALVQVYSGLVFEGPSMAGHILRSL